MSQDASIQFSFFAWQVANANGLLEGCDGMCLVTLGPPVCQLGDGETIIFWNHLNRAGLIPGDFLLFPTGTWVTNLNVDKYYPRASIGKGYVVVGCDSAFNYYMIIGVTTVINGTYTVFPQLSPQESYAMDSKMDDGMPNSGRIQARGNSASSNTLVTDSPPWSTANPNAAVPGDCVTGGASASDTANIYAMIGSVGTSLACMLRFQFQ